MTGPEDADVQDAMRQVRGTWPPWLLLAVTLGVAGWGGYRLDKQVGDAEELVEQTDSRMADRFAKMAVLEKTKEELERRLTSVTKENEALLPLKREQEAEAEALEAKKAVVEGLQGQIEERMKKEIGARKLALKQEEGVLSIRIEESLLFDETSPAVSTTGEEALVVLGAVIATVPIEVMQVRGHASPTDETPWVLSGSRAGAAARVLVEKARIDPKVVEVVAYGPSRPLVRGRSQRAAGRNRRLEITVEPEAPKAEAPEPKDSKP